MPYFDQVWTRRSDLQDDHARNLGEMKQALAMLQLMMQNIMVGTVDGDIYYVRNGRVPIRPAGFDYKRAMPGNTSKAEWQGIHKFEDLVQVHNPPQGYMQNCNVSPQFLMKDCTLKPSAEAPYLFNGFLSLTEAYDNPLHQRRGLRRSVEHDPANDGERSDRRGDEPQRVWRRLVARAPPRDLKRRERRDSQEAGPGRSLRGDRPLESPL